MPHSAVSVPLRVIVPTLGLAPGHAGSEDYNHALIDGLVARGHHVTALTPHRGGQTSGATETRWLAETPGGPGRFWWRFADVATVAQAARGVRKLRGERFDVLVSGLLPPLWAARWSWPTLPLVYVPQSVIAPQELKSYDSRGLQKLVGVATYHLLQRWALARADVVVSASAGAARVREQYFGVTPRRLLVSPLGVDLDRFAPRPVNVEKRREMGVPADASLVVSAGRLIPSKGFDFLLKSFARLKSSAAGTRTYLAIAGEGPARGALEALAASLGVASYVRFHGFEPRLERFLDAADLFVSASAMESFGLVLAQALSTGLPAVARRPRYPRVATFSDELIEDGVTGFLVDTQQEMSDRMETLLTDADSAASMRAAARRQARERFSWDRHVGDIEAVLVALTGRRPGAADRSDRPVTMARIRT